MTDEQQVAMRRALDGANLDADMRAVAESAMQRFMEVVAEPSAAQVVAENQVAADAGGVSGGGMDTSSGLSVAPMVPEPYHPVSPFRLKFMFGANGSYAGVTMENPVFIWNEPDADGNPNPTVKTAGVGTLSLNGTVYLNVTLTGDDGNKRFSSAQVSMSSGGDISVPLYELDQEKGAVKDYRHALVSLGVCGSRVTGDGASVDFVPGDDVQLEVRGFSEAEQGSALYKDGDEIVWDGKVITATNLDEGQNEFTLEYSDGESDTIPLPNDGTLTITVGDNEPVSFSANQDPNNPVAIVIPKAPAAANDGKFSVKYGSGSATEKFSANMADNFTLEFKDLTVKGNQNDDGTVVTPSDDTYNTGEAKTINLNGFVTLGTNQTIAGAKTFTSDVTVKDTNNANVKSVVGKGVLDLYTENGLTYVRFFDTGTRVARIYVNSSGKMTIEGNSVRLSQSPTIAPTNLGTSDYALYVATLGWVEQYFIRKLFAGNVSIAYDANGSATGTISIGKNDASGTKEDKVGLTLHLLPQPVVNDGKLKTKYGGATATATQLFSANQSGDATLTFNNLTVKGNQNDDGTVSSPSDDTYNTSEAKEINLKGFVTKGTDQTIAGEKTFTSSVTAVNPNSSGIKAVLNTSGLLDLHTTGNNLTYIRFFNTGQNKASIYVNSSGKMTIDASIVRLSASPTIAPTNLGTSDYALYVATLGWVDNYYQRKLTQGDGISLGTDPNDTNKVKISCTVEAAKDGKLQVKYGSGSASDLFTANQSSNSELAFKNLTVKGNQNDDGTVASPSDDTYNTGEAKTINLNGFVTKGTEQEISGYKKFTNDVRIYKSGNNTPTPILVVAEASANSGGDHVYYESGSVKINSSNPEVVFRNVAETKIGSVRGVIDGNNKSVVIDTDANGAQLANAPTTTLDNAANSKAISTLGWVASKLKTLSHGSTALGKIFASQNATIQRKQLVQGNGIVLTENGNQITISATGGGGGSGTSGYSTPSGTTDKSVADIMYDKTEHKFKIKYNSDVYANGLLVSRTTDSDWRYMDGGDAVEETV